MAVAADYAAVAIEVERVDDHRSAAFTVSGGVGRQWVDEAEKPALGARVTALRAPAGRVGVAG